MTHSPLLANPPWISEEDVRSSVSVREAIRAIQGSLEGGLDPARDTARSVVEVSHGQLLLMPAEIPHFVGVKIASVAPGNPALNRARIQGVYVLMDAHSLAPLALLDGVALTTLRTPAVSAAAALFLAPALVNHLVVFGSGPQARAHIDALLTIREISRITVVGRDHDRAAALAARLSSQGVDSGVGSAAAVADAQLIVCATTASTPLFDGELVAENSCTIAVGSHKPTDREFDSALARRAQVVVEDLATARREAGDVVIPIAEGVIDPGSLVALRDIVLGTVVVDQGHPRVFKSVGMSWQDLVVASAVYRARSPQ